MRHRLAIALFSVVASLILALSNIQPGRGLALLSAANADVGFADFPYNGITEPTGEKPQSKLWFNDGRWWADMLHTDGKHYIFSLDLARQTWINTGTQLDARTKAKSDCLWDGAHLYVASGVMSGANADGWLFRYSYDSASQTYTLEHGFPVVIRPGAAETLVIDKDSTGELWITYTQNSIVYVNHSLASDADWATPFAVPAEGVNVNVAPDDISSLVAFSGKIGVLWSNQTDETFYFAVHDDNDPDPNDMTWTGRIALRSPRIADDHINLKSLQDDGAGDLFAVVKTSTTGSSTPRILLLVRRLDGSWSNATIYIGAQNQTRPILLIDTEHRQLYVFSSEEGGGNVKYKQSSIDTIQFIPGLGTPFISSGTFTRINNATSTKQNVNAATGIVVLASDDQRKWYLHNYLDLSGIEPTATPSAMPTPRPTATPESTPAYQMYLPLVSR